jgi:hypothetical protein
LIEERSRDLNISTHELRYESPAHKIFLPQFKNEPVQEQIVTEQVKFVFIKGGLIMANIPGQQPDIKHCPICKNSLRNIPKEEMRSKGYLRKDGTTSPFTHTYECIACHTRFEINQDRKSQ